MMRWVVAAMPAVTALAFVRAGVDGFTTVKATLVWWAAMALLACCPAGRSRSGADELRWSAFARTAGALVVVLIVATVVAPSPLRALVGDAGRHSGVGVWIAALILAVAAARVARAAPAHQVGIVEITVAGSVPVSMYAMMQALGADPLVWRAVEGGPQVFSTLGNADYLSAWLGMVLPLALWLALRGGGSAAGWRVLGLAAWVLGLSAAIASGSLQGPVAGLAGSAIVVVFRRPRRWIIPVTVVMCVIGLSVVAGNPNARRSFETRRPIWAAAWRMAATAPIAGVGPGHFVDRWFQAIPDDAVLLPDPRVSTAGSAGAAGAGDTAGAGDPAVMRGTSTASTTLDRPVDDAHAVPLQVAATAGWPAALLLSALPLMALGQGIGTGAREDAAGLIGAVSAALVVWTVSVDAVPVTVTALMLTGTLYGAASPVPSGSGTPLHAYQRPQRVGRLVGVLALLVLGVVATAPMAADVVAGRAVAARSGPLSEARWKRASGWASWERRYPSMHSRELSAGGAFREALAAQTSAAERAPMNRATLVDLARLTVTVEGAPAALAAYATVTKIDPKTPVLQVEAATNALAARRPDIAIPLLQRALERVPEQQAWGEMLRAARILQEGA